MGRQRKWRCTCRYERYEVDAATGCWNWTGSIHALGYGQISSGSMRQAHRVVYERLRGPIPTGMDLHHECNNRRCVNPDHLTPMSHVDNCRLQKRHTFSVSEAREVRKVAMFSGNMAKVARIYGVKPPAIHKIVKGSTWQDVPPLPKESELMKGI